MMRFEQIHIVSIDFMTLANDCFDLEDYATLAMQKTDV
jgi:hypothetical protein